MIPAHLVDDFAELETWQDRAACRRVDSSIFFLELGARPDQARAICAQCAVRTECLEMALAEGLTFGIFGGKTPRERRVIRNQRRYAARRRRSA